MPHNFASTAHTLAVDFVDTFKASQNSSQAAGLLACSGCERLQSCIASERALLAFRFVVELKPGSVGISIHCQDWRHYLAVVVDMRSGCHDLPASLPVPLKASV